MRAKKSFAPVVGRPCSQVTNCMLSRRPKPLIASVFAARSPISVVVFGICSFLNVGTRSHRMLMSLCACVLFCMAPYPTYILCNFAQVSWEVLISLNIRPTYISQSFMTLCQSRIVMYEGFLLRVCAALCHALHTSAIMPNLLPQPYSSVSMYHPSCIRVDLWGIPSSLSRRLLVFLPFSYLVGQLCTGCL